VLLAIAALVAAVAIVYAIKPFHPTLSLGPGSSVVLVSGESCRAPIIAAWQSSPTHWAVTSGAPIPRQIYVTPCRTSARHRLWWSAVGLVVALVLVGLAGFLRQQSMGAAPVPDA
jgi:hypothetical protein